ncbi:MAG: MFS transporter [Spirochaetales bacterium]|uniref:MFS transporter n=1 Tax=Candidatus Thalassospirochaeta sargassi TaxID=3119039 RepID=A0AAJ1IJ06_9SPIO|nr:MFS transporter [Spirochaetales bacterium]
MGSADYVTSIGISLVVGMLAVISAAPKLMETFEKKHILFYACLTGAIVSLIPYFAIESVITGLISLGLSFFTIGIMLNTSTSMFIDPIDYSEWKLSFMSTNLPRYPLGTITAPHQVTGIGFYYTSRPNTIVNITATFDLKFKAMPAHKSQFD